MAVWIILDDGGQDGGCGPARPCRRRGAVSSSRAAGTQAFAAVVAQVRQQTVHAGLAARDGLPQHALDLLQVGGERGEQGGGAGSHGGVRRIHDYSLLDRQKGSGRRSSEVSNSCEY